MRQSGDMRLNFPGLSRRVRGKAVAWRVRVEGKPNCKITIPVGPDHPEFLAHYRAARAGDRLDPPTASTETEGTVGWVVQGYLDHLAKQVQAGTASPLTLKERRNLATFVLAQKSDQPRTRGREWRGLPCQIPTAELIAFKDRMLTTPGKARNVWKFMAAAYDHATERGRASSNPFRAVARPKYTSAGGAKPWSLDDLAQYRKAHPVGTMAHLCLTLFMFTACRIGDAYRLGREHEVRQNGALRLAWQPAKAGSRPVNIPILPPLDRAIRAQTVIGQTYLLTQAGKPFASPEALRNRFQKWCAEAGLEGLSSHGIRKAAGHLMALAGATQYEIMAVHGHANAATSQVYTQEVERASLGSLAASKLAGMDW